MALAQNSTKRLLKLFDFECRCYQQKSKFFAFSDQNQSRLNFKLNIVSKLLWLHFKVTPSFGIENKDRIIESNNALFWSSKARHKTHFSSYIRVQTGLKMGRKLEIHLNLLYLWPMYVNSLKTRKIIVFKRLLNGHLMMFFHNHLFKNLISSFI